MEVSSPTENSFLLHSGGEKPAAEPGGSIDQPSQEGGSATLQSSQSTSSAFQAVNHPDEDWTKISDLTERRRIQNRIAQRNYRQKIKERMQFLESKACEDNKKGKGSPTFNGSNDQQQHHAQRPRRRSSPPPASLAAPVALHQPYTPSMNPEDQHFSPFVSPPASSPPPLNNCYHGQRPATTWMVTGTPKLQATTIVPTLPPVSDFSEAAAYNKGNSVAFATYGEHPLLEELSQPVLHDVRLPNLETEDSWNHLEEDPNLPTILENDPTLSGDKGRPDRHSSSTQPRNGADQPSFPTPSHVASDQRHNGNDITPAPPFRSPISLSENTTTELPRQQRARSSKPKVKTGCNNCKQRRIKCDEKRPACSNCIRSNKPCSGYLPPPRIVRPYEDIRMAPTPEKDAFPPSINSQSAKEQPSPWRTTQYRRQDEASLVLEVEEPPYLLFDAEDDELPLEKPLDSYSDDDTSIGSFTESVSGIRSTLASKATSASSFRGNSNIIVASFVDILTGNKNMNSLLAMATAEFGFSSGRFTKNFSRILKSYSRHLKQVVESSSEDALHRHRCFRAASLIHNARYQISGLIATRYNEKEPAEQDFRLTGTEMEPNPRHLSQRLPADNGDVLSNEESSGDETDSSTAGLEKFLLSGEPYQHLKRKLRSLITPDEFLQFIDESAHEFVNLAMADRRTRPFISGLRRVLAIGQDPTLNLTSHLRAMAEDLKFECAGTSQLDVAMFRKIYSEYISAVAMDQARQTPKTHSESAVDPIALQGEGPQTHLAEEIEKSCQRLVRAEGTRGEANSCSASVEFSAVNSAAEPRSWAGGATFWKKVEHMNSNTTSPGIGVDSAAVLTHQALLEDIVDGTMPLVHYVDLVPHLAFPSSSTAFASFLNALRDLVVHQVYRSFFPEASNFVRSTIRSAEASEDWMLALEGQRLLPILTEMQSCSQHNSIRISLTETLDEAPKTLPDKAKLAIEASTAAEWDWWPLQAPDRSKSPPGGAGLSWQCSCGTKRQESILPSYGQELRIIHDKFPLDPFGGIALADRPTSSLSNISAHSTRSAQSASSSSTSVGGGQSSSGSASTSNSAITNPGSGDDTLLTFGTGPRQYIYIFLLVRASEYALDTVDVSSMRARDFFKALRRTYREQRGLWRRIFSIFVYNHCDFVKIIRPEPDTFMPGEQSFELPSDHDDQYQYQPRPTLSAPVTKHMFRHYFYGCYDSDTLMHRLHASLPLMPACRIRNPASELLDYFPKRDRKVAASAQSDKVEVCYGLVARECRSFHRVVVYLLLIMAPAIWFIFAWLFQWGNEGDLQDATVPITLMLTSVSVLWAVVYSGSDVRKDYGNGGS